MNEVLELAQALNGARIGEMLPYLTQELDRMGDACVVRVDNLLRDGKLTPDLAQMAWIEMLGYRRLKRRLEQQVRLGTSMGEKHTALLSGEPPLPI